MVKALSVRVPEDLSNALDTLASLLERPRSYLVRKALEAYVEEYADYQIALDRLRDKDDKVISGKELRKRLGL